MIRSRLALGRYTGAEVTEGTDYNRFEPLGFGAILVESNGEDIKEFCEYGVISVF